MLSHPEHYCLQLHGKRKVIYTFTCCGDRAKHVIDNSEGGWIADEQESQRGVCNGGEAVHAHPADSGPSGGACHPEGGFPGACGNWAAGH